MIETTESRDVLATIERDRQRYLDELRDYLRIPSISTDPEYAGDVARCAAFLRDRMEEAGLSAEILPTAGHPLVYAERFESPQLPTVLFYGHYDVQPADPLEEWRHDPFDPTLEDGRLVARGATDDKGQSYAHVKAVEALLASRGRLPANVKFLVEGEEESGGAAIERFVREDGGERLACDCVVISDSSMYAPGQPAMVIGLRGMAYMELEVRGPERDLHSGTYGGAVANPLNALAEILASLKDPATGRVAIAGFYDDVRPLDPEERRELAQLPFDEEAYEADLGVDALPGEEGYSPLERVAVRPTCDVHGIWGGYSGPGAKTVIPARGAAKVSMRLVPDQRPERVAKLFADHVRRHTPPGVTAEVVELHRGEGVVLATEGPYVEAAMASLQEVWGAPPVRVREGGSIPVVNTFDQVLGVPVLLMGFGLPDDRLHSPNEKIDLAQFYGGIHCTVRFLDRVGELAE
ncbi:MAG TPA: dipeptidase [Thermoanaerobaculia bacterium]|nr:dipeptidase [Thermoanaerobaculia bacterium]